MLMVFHLGTSWEQYSKISVIRRMEGLRREDVGAPGGIFLEDVVLDRPAAACAGVTPCFSATAMYMARRMAAGALMVMEVLTLSRGIPSKRISMSSSESMATPTLPTSPWARGWSES